MSIQGILAMLIKGLMMEWLIVVNSSYGNKLIFMRAINLLYIIIMSIYIYTQ